MTNSLSHIELETGKLPPQALEFEEAVLGAIMLESDALEDVYQRLSNDLWYKDAHRLIYGAIKKLYEAKAPVDMITVVNKLKEWGQLDQVGGAYYISQLTSKVSSSANIEYHLTILIQQALKRKQIYYASQTIQRAYDDSVDVFESIGIDAMHVADLENFVVGDITEFDISASITRTVKHLQEPKKNDYPGLSTGNGELSHDIGGFQPGDLIYLGARPSEGKTDAMLNHAFHLALKNIPVAVFSLETVVEHKINIRMLSYFSEIDNRIVASGKWTESEASRIGEAEQRISSLPLYLFDNPFLTPNTFRAIARKLIKDKGITMAFIDYIQLVLPDKQNKGTREQELSQISRSMKIIAKELQIPVMALAQLSRAMESRTGLLKRPRLSDFRESGSLEQDADVIMTLFGPDRNEIPFEVWNIGGFTEDTYSSVIERAILKNKNGPANKILVEYYNKPNSHFSHAPLLINQAALPLTTEQKDLPF